MMDTWDIYGTSPPLSPEMRFFRKCINLDDMDYSCELHQADSLVIPPPYLIRNDNNCLSDTFAYLSFSAKPIIPNLTASQDWLSQRTEKSLDIRKKISAWLSTQANYIQVVYNSDISQHTVPPRSSSLHAKTFCKNDEENEENGIRHMSYLSSTRGPWPLSSYLTKENNGSWNDFSESVCHESVWLNDPCLTAIAEVFQRRIIVYFTGSDDPYHYLPSGPKNNNEPWSIAFVSNHHFVPLLKPDILIPSDIQHHSSTYRLFVESSYRSTNDMLDDSSTNISSTQVFAEFMLRDFGSEERRITLQPLMTIAPEKLASRSIYKSLIGWKNARKYHTELTNVVVQSLPDLQQKAVKYFRIHSTILSEDFEKFEASLKDTSKTAKRVEKNVQRVERQWEEQRSYEETWNHNSEDEDEDEDVRESKEEMSRNYLQRRNDATSQVDKMKNRLQELRAHVEKAKKKNDLLPSEALDICTQIDIFFAKSNITQDRIERLNDSDRSESDFSSESTTDENDNNSEDEELTDEEMEAWVEVTLEKKIQHMIELINECHSTLNRRSDKSNAKDSLGVLHQLEKEFDNNTFKRPGSLYIIFADNEPVYIGLTTDPITRFSEGHHTFTKLLAPKYRERKLRIRFFSLNINERPLEWLENPVDSSTTSEKQNDKKKKQSGPKDESKVQHGPKLLACVEQLLIYYFKPILNGDLQGKKSWNGIPAPSLLSDLYIHFRYADIMPDEGKSDATQKMNSIAISVRRMNQA